MRHNNIAQVVTTECISCYVKPLGTLSGIRLMCFEYYHVYILCTNAVKLC